MLELFLPWLLPICVSGIIGNRTDATFVSITKNVLKQVQVGKIVNHDMQKALNRSFLLSLENICDICLSELKSESGSQKGNFIFLGQFRWLEEKKLSVEDELKAVEKTEYKELTSEILDEVKSLLAQDDPTSIVLQKIKKELFDRAEIGNNKAPECYKKHVEENILNQMCTHFAYEIKENQAISNILETQLLIQLDIKIDSILVYVSSIVQNLNPIPDMAKKLDSVYRVAQSFDSKDKKFVAPSTYFSKYEKFLVQLSDLKIDSFEKYLASARKFVVSQNGYIFMIHSPGGYGKSHLLHQIVNDSSLISSEIEMLIITPGYPEINDALEKEIVPDKKYLLIFDDADRFIGEVESLVAYVKSTNNNVKIILASRTSGFQNINNIIGKYRCEELCDEIKINRWSNAELIQLLRFVTGQEKLDDEEMIVNFLPIPFFIVWYGRQIKGDLIQDFEKIKIKFITEISYEAESSLSGILPASKVKDFLLALALIVPFISEDEDVITILSRSAEEKEETIKSALEMLEKTEILRVVGNSLRYYPDMKGDLYLSYKLNDIKNYSNLESLIEKWVPRFAENIFKNTEAARRYEEIKLLKTYFSKFINTKISMVEITSGYERKEILKLAQFIVEVVPEDCLSLIYVYLNTPLPEDSSIGALWNKLPPTTDDYGPIIIKLIKTSYSRNEILELIHEINNKKIEGTYSDYKPQGLLAYSISPLENSPEKINEVLAILRSWIDICDESVGELIAYPLSSLLAGTHEYTKYGFGKFSWRCKPLNNTPEVLSNRTQAICTLRKMIKSSSLEFKLLAIKVSRNIGYTHSSIKEEDLPLSIEIADERKQLINDLRTFVSPQTDFRLLSRIEDLFLVWWAQEINGTEEVKYILRDFPQIPEYIAFKYHSSVLFLIENFASIERTVPKENRWSWFVHTFSYKSMNLKPENIQSLVDFLNIKYNTEESVIEYLCKLDKVLEPHRLQPLIIDCWIRLNQKNYFSIRKKASLWQKVPSRFKSTIDFTIADLNAATIDELAQEVISDLPLTDLIKVDNFLRLLGVHTIDTISLHLWISELLDKGNLDIRILLVEYLDFIFGKRQDYNCIVKISISVISKEEKLNDNLIQSLAIFTKSALAKHENLVKGTLLDELKKELLQKLQDVPTLDYHAQELLEFSFTNIDCALEFLDARIFKLKDLKDYNYEIIPYEGIECISSLIYSYEDFEKLLDKFIFWLKENNSVTLNIKRLIKSIRDLRDKFTEKLYFVEYIEKQVDLGAIDKAIIVSYYLPFEEDNFDLLIKVADKSIAAGKLKDIYELFDYFTFLENVSTRFLGESSPDLLLRKELFQKMSQKVNPGPLKLVIKKNIEEINAFNERDSKSDEETLNPKL